MDFSKYTNEISTLTLISSCGCNLKCSYCEIAKAVNEDAPRLQEETKAALENGMFLENVKKVFEKLSINPNDIVSMDLWGQEPTLTLEKFTAHLEDWLNYVPNLNKFFFSTNGMAYPEKIVDLVVKMDSLIPKERKLEFLIQTSYDGDLSTNNIRNAEAALIQKNLMFIVTELNKHKIENIEFKLHVHGVVSLELIHLLDTSEKVLDYFNNMADWIEPFKDLSINKNVKFDYSPSLALENPVDATTEDGLALATFAKRVQQLDRNKMHSPDFMSRTIQYFFSPPFAIEFVAAACDERTIEKWVNRIFEDRMFYNEATRFLAPNIFCGTNKFGLKIMYDGTLISCQNNIFDRDKNTSVADTPFLRSVKDSWVDHNLFVNPLIDKDEDIQRLFELYQTVQLTSWRFLLEHYIITMYWLSRAGQIDIRYSEDQYLLVKHALMLIKYNECLYNNFVKAGSAFMRGNGWFRFFFNGFADILEFEYNKTLSSNVQESQALRLEEGEKGRYGFL